MLHSCVKRGHLTNTLSQFHCMHIEEITIVDDEGIVARNGALAVVPMNEAVGWFRGFLFANIFRLVSQVQGLGR